MRRVRNKEIASIATTLTESRYNRVELDTAQKSPKQESVAEHIARGGRIKVYDSKGKFIGYK